MQQKQGAVPLRQRGERPPDTLDILGAEQRSFRAGVRAITKLGADQREAPRAPFGDACLIARQVVRDREQPRPSIPWLTPEQAHERLLGDVLRQVRVSESSAKEADEAWIPLLEEGPNSAYVAWLHWIWQEPVPLL
jgi:hypothetical protein